MFRWRQTVKKAKRLSLRKNQSYHRRCLAKVREHGKNKRDWGEIQMWLSFSWTGISCTGLPVFIVIRLENNKRDHFVLWGPKTHLQLPLWCHQRKLNENLWDYNFKFHGSSVKSILWRTQIKVNPSEPNPSHCHIHHPYSDLHLGNFLPFPSVLIWHFRQSVIMISW